MLLLLLKTKFPDFVPEKDKILGLADKLLESQILDSSGIMRYSFDDFIRLSRDEATNIFTQEKNQKLEAFSDEFNSINNEIISVSRGINEFYTSSLNLKTELGNREATAQNVLYLIEQYCIKVKRLNFVAAPDYSLSTGFSKKSKKKYETIKAFWIDANGNKVRSFSKNVGIAGLDVEESVVKLFESLGYITTQLEYPLNNGVRVDLIVEKDNKKWVIEIKMKDKKRFFDTYARLELWKLYQSLYLG